ncbi:MAG TPA: response regulator [Rhizomicrobium sp.]|nr:response regulator [Rhizomicrobium sp.]
MPEAGKIKTLVVDDMSSMRTLVRASLRQFGINDVIECCDGAEALDTLRRFERNLVISDLNMPKMDGLGLLRAVRADPALAKTPFILLTSRGEIELVKQAIALGVSNYITKPFAFGALQKKIEAVFGPLT